MILSKIIWDIELLILWIVWGILEITPPKKDENGWIRLTSISSLIIIAGVIVWL